MSQLTYYRRVQSSAINYPRPKTESLRSNPSACSLEQQRSYFPIWVEVATALTLLVMSLLSSYGFLALGVERPSHVIRHMSQTVSRHIPASIAPVEHILCQHRLASALLLMSAFWCMTFAIALRRQYRPLDVAIPVAATIAGAAITGATISEVFLIILPNLLGFWEVLKAVIKCWHTKQQSTVTLPSPSNPPKEKIIY
ncbi:hypothetical protein K449DRAFT_421067 [Hypoxylon sp. EC38]|nr:hypothetical protein K449DRAFT_421067 [Hypoxylon sp. EC38]